MQGDFMVKNRSGFTLIEIMIALTIVMLLMTAAVVSYRAVTNMAKNTTTTSTMQALKQAITLYNMQTGLYPETLRDLVEKPTNEEAAQRWGGPYLEAKKVPRDGWGNPFHYRQTPDQENPYELYSFGAKGKGAPKNEHIDVWKM